MKTFTKIELTDEDRAEIQRICNDDRIDHDPYDVDIALYRAGLAAGRARILDELDKDADRLFELADCPKDKNGNWDINDCPGFRD